MAREQKHLDHIFVTGHAVDEAFTRRGGGKKRVRDVDRREHGTRLIGEIVDVFAGFDDARYGNALPEELQASGTVIVLEGAESVHLLRTESLESYTSHRKTPKKPKWLLLSVHTATESCPERAKVWVSDGFREKFLQLFRDYLDKDSKSGNPQNQELVTNISKIRRAVVADLWTSEGNPPKGKCWWELWLHSMPGDLEALDHIAKTWGITVSPRSVSLNDRTIVWVEADLTQLEVLLFSSVVVAEIRQPRFIDTVEDLDASSQEEYVEDLAGRIFAAAESAPAVCVVDTGVFRHHRLLKDSLAAGDHHSIVNISGNDVHGHGTSMAGLALLGNIDAHLTTVDTIKLRHRLESVGVWADQKETTLNKLDFGTATIQATALCEAANPRHRVICIALSTKPDLPGFPTLWSATIDALAVGTDVVRDGDQLRLLSEPDPHLSRLFVVAAGNVDQYRKDHRLNSETSAIEDPAQSWNALTVGAFTELDQMPEDPQYAGWEVVAKKGDLSPHTRTSLFFKLRGTPIKPDICMEGGNVITDGQLFEDRLPLLSLRSTGLTNDSALISANATSAAAAQAARLAALAMERYPSYWPETIRGLLTHAAEWTPSMRAEIKEAGKKTDRLVLLRQFGWGVPSENAVLNSTGRAVTLVSQDQFVPFTGSEYSMPRFRLHEIPWPKETLQQIGTEEVRLRVTLSYFIEPTASRRGWRKRYSYASHGLRFLLQRPMESDRDFVSRINQVASGDESPTASKRRSKSVDWTLGEQQRHYGSLHQDEWVTTGYELAVAGSVAVYPVGGWWKNNKRINRRDLPVRYSLIVSLRTQTTDVDLYTPIQNSLEIESHLEVPTQTELYW